MTCNCRNVSRSCGVRVIVSDIGHCKFQVEAVQSQAVQERVALFVIFSLVETEDVVYD